MRFTVKLKLAFNRLDRRISVGSERGLYQVAGLIRQQARRSMRVRKGASKPGKPPTAHTPTGLREIRFDVTGDTAYIGPRKFSGSKFFNRPVPNIHEFGGTAVYAGIRKRVVKKYPERSFMWNAVKSLQSRDLILKKFAVTLQRNL